MYYVKRLAATILAGMLLLCCPQSDVLDIYADEASVRASDLTGIGSSISEMFLTQGELNTDNTWMFAGGVETQGRYEEIAGRRSYVGHFQECVRRTDGTIPEDTSIVIHNGENPVNQRYVINVGREGLDLEAFMSKWEEYVQRIDPRAVSYLIGEEDFHKGASGLDKFQETLKTLIENALTLRDGEGFAVIQLPHAVNDAQEMENISLYAEAAKEVVSEFPASDLARIVLADHFTATNTSDFLNGNKLTEEGRLNAEGHLVIGRQLCEATIKNLKYFSVVNQVWEEEESPEIYLDLMPEVIASENGIHVTIPEEAGFDGGCRWRLEIEGVVMENEESTDSFTIRNLSNGLDYKLTVFSQEGDVQLSSVYGTIEEGELGAGLKRNPLQQQLANKLEEGGSLTWLFMGDSITHGLLHTSGFDSIAQSFEKYITEDIGRVDDIVINTGVSATDTLFTLEHITERMSKYNPDVVSVMLGTNDVFTTEGNPPTHKDENGNKLVITKELYKKNLENIVSEIRDVNPDAFIIFRSPSPTSVALRKDRLTNGGYLQAMKEVASDNDILYIDQYEDWAREMETFSYLWNKNYYFNDRSLHPGVAGQQRMLRQFVSECGLNTDTRMANLSYQFHYTDETSSAAPDVKVLSGQSVEVSLEELQEAYGSGGTIGCIELTLQDSYGASYTKRSKPGEAFLRMEHLPSSRHYTASVTAWMAGGTAKRVTFAQPEEMITLSTGTEEEDVNRRLNELEDIFNGSQGHYTEESLSEFQKIYRRVQDSAGQETDVEILADLLDELNAAYGMLQVDQEFMEAEKALKDALGTYEAALNSDREKYTENSWLLFSEACRKAKEALQQGGKSKDELKTLLSGMQEAFQALEERAKKLAAPAIKSLKAVSEKRAFGVKIEVEAVPDADAYTVYRTAGGKETVIGRTDATKAVYDENPVGGQESLYYAVAESSAKGFETSDKGAPKTIRMAAAAKKIKAKQPKGKAQASVTWKAAKGAKSYIVYRSEKKDAGYVRLATVKGAKKTAYLDRKAKKGKTFYYKVVVKTKTGYGAPAVSKAVKIK